MNKKKVLFVATITRTINAFLIPYLKMFKEKGYEVHVASNGDEQIEYCDKHFNIQFARFPIKSSNLKAYKELKIIINENNYEIIHCHTPVAGVLTRLAARKARKKGSKVFYTAHGFHFYKGAPKLNWIIYYPIEKICARWTDCLITINSEDYERAKRKFKKCKRIELVHGVGMDTSRFEKKLTNEEKLEFRKSLGIKEDDIVFSYVAELNKNKNQILLINTIKELKKEMSNIKLLLISDGPLYNYYNEIIEKENLQENVFLLGKRKDINEILSITDIYLASSLREGLPVNIMEAMYKGLPIIATDNRGHRELVKEGDNGYLVDVRANYKLFVDKIRRLNNKDEYMKYIENSKKILKKFKIYNVLEEMEKIYHKKKKILHLLNTNSFSGAENVVCQIINMFKKEIDNEMFYCSKDGNIREILNKKDIAFIPIKRLNIYNLNKIVKENGIDLIHAHDVRASFIASFINIPVISHIHGNHLFMRKITSQSILYNWRAKKFRHIYFVSKSSFENYIFKNKIKNKSSILYNVIDINEILKKLNEDTEKYKFDIIYLGRLSEEKNPMRMVQILDRVVRQRNTTKCAIIGDGEYYNKLEKYIIDNELENNIRMFGYKNNPYKVLNCSKILIMTSIHEGLPMVALEAMSLSIPIISTPVDGLNKIIKNNINGYLSNNDDELVNYIIELLNNDMEYKNMKANCKGEFNKINDVKKYKNEILRYY